MEFLVDPQIWIALLTLTALEIVLGIDNIVFIAILVGRLPQHQRPSARRVGLLLAMALRVLLLLSLTWIMQLTAPLFSIWSNEISGRDLILILGGLFLLAKSTHEIHHRLEGDAESQPGGKAISYAGIIAQILLLDIVFSLDSVITAIGMAQHIEIMVAAVVLAVLFMLVFARSIADFVEAHPTVKMLALNFLLLIGVILVADGLGHHIPKGYIYFALFFSVLVETLNLRAGRKKKAPLS